MQRSFYFCFNRILNIVKDRLHVWDQVIAELDYSRGLNGELVLQLAEDAVTSATAGWALIETEPIKYSLQVASNIEYIIFPLASIIYI